MTTIDNIIDEIFTPDTNIIPKLLEENQVTKDTIEKIKILKSIVLQQQMPQVQQQQVQNASLEDTFSLIHELKESLKNSLVKSKNVQNLITWMFSLTFILGFILIAFAIYFGAAGEEFLATAFGAFGMASIVTLLVKDPPLKMQDSRSNYAQLSLGIIAWMNDFIDKGAMAQQNAIINNRIQDNPEIDHEKKREANKDSVDLYLALSNTQINNTIKLLKIIDKVAEPGNMDRVKRQKKSKNTMDVEEKAA